MDKIHMKVAENLRKMREKADCNKRGIDVLCLTQALFYLEHSEGFDTKQFLEAAGFIKACPCPPTENHYPNDEFIDESAYD